jgi:D-alanyl-D-alanine carboxypeptidase/D-alanyl-D-alanine-endopeptidase (penicillin-binding protein 4)
MISACGQAHARRSTGTFSNLARSAPSRLPSHAIGAGKTTTTGGNSLTDLPAVGLKRQVKRALAHSGTQVGLLVEDLSNGQVLDSRADMAPRPPASVEKLYTTVAALNLLGPEARLQTTVLGTGGLGADGVWHGNLYVHGGGDPTFGDGNWNRLYEDGYGPTALELAKQLRRAGIRRVTGHLFADDSLFDTDPGGPATHNGPDTPDYGGEMNALVYDHGMSAARMPPAVFAGHELALTMRGIGIRVGAASRTRPTPAAAVELAHVESPPLSVLVRLMDVPSDDLIADMLAKQLGARLAGEGTLAAGAEEISQAIASGYGLQPRIFDGSGLDRADRTTPYEVVTLLRKLWTTPTGALLYAALPIVGKQGTVASIGVHTPAEGRCVAKTGTLNGVTNLAGYCRALDGDTLAFALMIDGPANYLSYPVLSRVVAAIARY